MLAVSLSVHSALSRGGVIWLRRGLARWHGLVVGLQGFRVDQQTHALDSASGYQQTKTKRRVVKRTVHPLQSTLCPTSLRTPAGGACLLSLQSACQPLHCTTL